jgi:NAD(P)-dependent dehydrogenase (short-subunit alcohol dehydrogenase family)
MKMTRPIIKFDDNFVALISAGASGIGKVVAQSLLSLGAQVHICDISQSAITEFLEENPNASATLCDVADYQQVEKVYQELTARYGRLDLLVNNAGIAGPTAKLEDIEPSEWRQTIDIDLNAQFYFSKLAAPLLKANPEGGSIINMSSNAGFFGFPLRSPYTASKWAILGLTKTWAMELGPSKIRVNAICPGSVKGKRIDGVIARDAQERGVSIEEITDTYQQQSSMRLFVGPEDIANTIAFLASPLGACISGQTIGLDGHTESLSNNL